MKAKLIREIPQREGLPYYFKTYEFECIECGRHYTRHQYNDRISPYCASCGMEHYKQRQKEQAKVRQAKRDRELINSVLEDIKAEIEEKREVLMKQGGVFEHSAYGLDYALLIINEHMRGTENESSD